MREQRKKEWVGTLFLSYLLFLHSASSYIHMQILIEMSMQNLQILYFVYDMFRNLQIAFTLPET